MSEANGKRARIDWAAARARVQKAIELSERAGLPLAEHVDAAYRKRAELLSRPVSAEGESSQAEEIVVFRIGSERFAVPLASVSEILTGPPCTPVPGAPPEVAGVIQVRGEIRPVCELSRILGLPEEEKATVRSVLLLRGAGREFGAIIDSVEDIRAVPAGERRAPPEALARRAAWLTPDMVPVLNVEKLFEGKAQ